MGIVGAKKQEEKLILIAKMAKKLFPDVNELAVKGALRYGAKAAIEKSQFSDWSEVADQPESVRRNFFDKLLQEARPYLENLIGKEKIDDFIRKVRVENEKFLKGKF